MLEHTEARLNQVVFVGYYLDTPASDRLHTRVRIADVLKRRAGMEVSGRAAHGNGPVRSASSTGPAVPLCPPAAVDPCVVPEEDAAPAPVKPRRKRAGETPEARAARIARIQDAIADGSYDTDEKLDAALARLLEVHGLDLDD